MCNESFSLPPENFPQMDFLMDYERIFNLYAKCHILFLARKQHKANLIAMVLMLDVWT